ncbi:MAG TPA: thioredoxin family protein [Puia sp.]|uniref:thioredoxin family protein n=1 Tax=Puia sp. TaxID=2045100 RepID=UPI002C1C514F|nr:thioredoxin family protein [Puia sp.]HVU99651.1 thioredoxin family protein [Puia sp.]
MLKKIGYYMIFPALLAGIMGAAVEPPRDKRGTKQLKPMAIPTPREGRLPSFSGATLWLNSQPLTAADVRGKVVLVEFWTYTCINWRRTLPYVRTWADRYKDKGLVVIGVHTPEFGFEKNADNVRWAIKDMDIDFPVAMDNNYTIWRAFNNQYWPALYFIDARGDIRHHQFGEGSYEQSEKVIQQLLREAGASGVSELPTPVETVGAEVAADWGHLGSGENYLGFERTSNFASPGGAEPNRRQVYVAPARLRLNEWALAGDWSMGTESDVLNGKTGRVVYRFHARDVNLIMGPAAKGHSVGYRVLIDGKEPGDAHGVDVDARGNGKVTGQRMYQLIRQREAIADREFAIEFLGPGVEVFDFTFG